VHAPLCSLRAQLAVTVREHPGVGHHPERDLDLAHLAK
jgi:hypothetical protein